MAGVSRQLRSVSRIHDNSDYEWAAHRQDQTRQWLSDPQQNDASGIDAGRALEVGKRSGLGVVGSMKPLGSAALTRLQAPRSYHEFEP